MSDNEVLRLPKRKPRTDLRRSLDGLGLPPEVLQAVDEAAFLKEASSRKGRKSRLPMAQGVQPNMTITGRTKDGEIRLGEIGDQEC